MLSCRGSSPVLKRLVFGFFASARGRVADLVDLAVRNVCGRVHLGLDVLHGPGAGTGLVAE